MNVTPIPITQMEQPNTHTYLGTHRMRGQVLRFRLPDEEQALHEQTSLWTSGRAGKTLVKQGALRIMQVALRRGSPLGSHRIAGPVSIQVLRGRLRLTTTDGERDLESGELVVLDAGVAHAAEATTDCVVLVTMSIERGLS